MSNSAALAILRRDDINLFKDRTVIRIPFEDVEGAWIIVSFGSDGHRERMMQEFTAKYRPELYVHSVTTFLFDAGKVAAEWEPQYGPITVWNKCDKSWRSDDEHPREPRQHWFYDWVQDNPGNWSQLAVDDERLKEKLVAGQLTQIFDVLKSWAQ